MRIPKAWHRSFFTKVRGLFRFQSGLLLLIWLLPIPSRAATIRVPQDFSTIQQAINASANGDTVLVAPGTYRENITFKGKAITVNSEFGPEVTIINASRAGAGVAFTSGEGATSVLQGFTIEQGGFGFGGIFVGGIPGSAPTIRRNIITNNPDYGIFIENAGAPQVLNNTISNNTNGGIYLESTGTPFIRGNIISRNGRFSFGILVSGFSAASIVQNLIIGNGFSGIWITSLANQGPSVLNNTIADNGIGIRSELPHAQIELINNIVIANAGQTAVSCQGNPPIFRFNNIFSSSGTKYAGICTDQTGLNGNISADPLFLDPANDLYYLRPGSPAIDAGDNLAQNLPLTDLDGDPRILDGDENGSAIVDLGAFETSPSPGIVQFESSNFAAVETSSSATISVIRKGGSTGQVTVDFSTSNGTAQAGLDYVATSGTLTLLNGESSKSFSVPIINDNLNEGTETVNLTLTNVTGGATLGTNNTAVLKITEAGSLQFSASSYSVNENAGGATITITRTGGSAGPVSVIFAASKGTATLGSDYSSLPQTVSFGDGDTVAKIVVVSIFNDVLSEGNETVSLTLINPTGDAVLGDPSTAVLTIIDDEPPPIFPTARYFPLQSGAFWTYSVDGSCCFTTTVLPGTTNINGVETKALQDTDGFTQYFTNDGNGLRLHRQVDPGSGIVYTFNPPILLADVVINIGQTVSSSGTAQTNSGSVAYTSSFTVQAFENVTVPLRNFAVVRVQGTIAVSGAGTQSYTFYLARNAGVVKEIYSDGTNGDTTELVATNVKQIGDFDGDGKSDIGYYRAPTWLVFRSSDGGAIQRNLGGLPQDILAPADYDGDGKADIAIYRNGAWLILRSSDGGDTVVGWGGAAQDIPVPADYDGDGKADIAIYRGGAWSIKRSSDGGNTVVGWGGAPQDIPVPGDYDGDGKTDIAI